MGMEQFSECPNCQRQMMHDSLRIHSRKCTAMKPQRMSKRESRNKPDSNINPKLYSSETKRPRYDDFEDFNREIEEFRAEPKRQIKQNSIQDKRKRLAENEKTAARKVPERDFRKNNNNTRNQSKQNYNYDEQNEEEEDEEVNYEYGQKKRNMRNFENRMEQPMKRNNNEYK